MDAKNLISDLVYINYAHNRTISPEVPVANWAAIYANAEAMEARFQLESRHHLEAEAFRAKHDIHSAVSSEEISEVMGLAELGLLPKICPACATKHGEQQCWGHGCQCACEEAAADRVKR
jgi:hypothetical protein